MREGCIFSAKLSVCMLAGYVLLIHDGNCLCFIIYTSLCTCGQLYTGLIGYYVELVLKLGGCSMVGFMLDHFQQLMVILYCDMSTIVIGMELLQNEAN